MQIMHLSYFPQKSSNTAHYVETKTAGTAENAARQQPLHCDIQINMVI